MKRRPVSTRALILALGYFFLYAPIIVLVGYSFNASKFSTVWTGFSVRWYGALLHDQVLVSAAWLSLRIAFYTACAAVVIGTWVGFVLARFGRFPGFAVFAGMAIAPLVIPEVIQGIALLLLFIALQHLVGWPRGRGPVTIWIGHVMLSLSYVAIVVRSRVNELDRSLEEAAMDLGAKPLKVFFVITLPLLAQALISGWLLTFTLSFDDFIASAFLSGPGSSTLPLVVFARVRGGLNPEMNALATVLISLATAGVIGFNLFASARDRKRARDRSLALGGA